MSARSWAPWVVATLVLAAAVHIATVWYLPHFVMNRALAKMGAPNMVHHGVRVTAASRGIVRPSPDLLYSTCPFDLSKGPLLVTARVPTGTYWSVSLFDANTNNFFVLNDRQAKGAVELIVTPPKVEKIGTMSIVDPGAPPIMPNIVPSPTMRGLVLFRTLINDETKFAAIDKTRRQANCGPFTK